MKLSLLSLFVVPAFAIPALAAAAPTALPPKPTLAPRGMVETVAQIMARPEVQPNPDDMEKDDSDHYPDRSQLPQNPSSLFVSSYPPRMGDGGGSTSTADASLRGGLKGGGIGAFVSLASGFEATTSDETPYRPPDTQGDVSPTQILVCINGRIKVFDRSGALGSLNTTTDTFFASVRGSSISDPRVRWDPNLQRWVVIAIDVASTNNRLVIAVSNSATVTATSSFSFFYFNEAIGGATARFFDYPTLGVDKNALYIGGNMFTSSSGSFVGNDGWVVRKSSLTAGGSPVVTHFIGLSASGTEGPYTPQGVNNDDPNATEGYFIGTSTTTKGRLILRRVTDPAGSPAISGNLSLTVPATATPADVSQPSSTATLDSLDDRLFLAKICEGPGGTRTIWTAHNIGTNTSGVASSGGKASTRWYQIGGYATGSTPTLIQAGTVYDSASTNPVAYWIPSIVQTPQGNAYIGGSYGGAAVSTGVFWSYRRSGDALGTQSAPSSVIAGSGAYTGTRWGDYSMATVDPNDGQSVWIFQEHVVAGNKYGVYVQKVLSDAPAATSASANSARRGGTITMAVTGTNFYDSPSRYTNHLTAAVSGTGVTVNSVTYLSPTQVNLSLTVAANAALGARTVTITNPDGQSTTATFTVQSILVSGTVSYGDYSASAPRPATVVELLDGSNNVVDTRTITPAADGTFSYEPSSVNAGVYSVRVKASHWLRRRVSGVNESGGSASFTASLINGDVDGDNQILGSDYNAVRAAYGSSSSSGNWNANADLDGDGQVLGSDYAIVRSHYGQAGDN